MTGPYLVAALIGGPISESRYRKAAHHIRTQFEWDAFLAALRDAHIDNDRRLAIEAAMRKYVKV